MVVSEPGSERGGRIRALSGLARGHYARISGSGVTSVLATAFLGQALLLLSGPLLARALGPTGRGEFALFLISASVVTQLFGLGLPASVTFHLAARRVALAQLRRWARGWLVLVVCAAAVTGVLLFTLQQFNRLPRTGGLGLMGAALAAAIMFQTMQQAVLQGSQLIAQLNRIRILPAAGLVVTALSSYVIAIHDVAIVIPLYTVFMLIAAGVAVWTTGRAGSTVYFKSSVSRSDVFRYGRRALVSSVNPLDSFSVDQAAVGVVLSANSLGIYVVAAAFGNLSSFLLSSLGLVATPRLAAASGSRPEERRLTGLFLAAGVALAGAISLTLILLVPILIPLFFGRAFEAAVPVARILIASGFFLAFRRLLTAVSQGLGIPGAASTAEGVTFFCFLAGLAVLVPAHGVEGAATALLSAGVLASALLLHSIARRLRAEEGRGPSLSEVADPDP